jgi:RHS repeat-associated protein
MCDPLTYMDDCSVQHAFLAYKFTGKERDSESGLDNFEKRYNASSMGRFMSPDPANFGALDEHPQTWNAYSYVANNPLNAIDPHGLDCVYVSEDQKSATVRTGDCKSDTDNGIFVDGTVKSVSLSVSNQGDVLNIGFQPEGGGDLTLHPENLGQDASGLSAGIYNYVPKSDFSANLQKPSAAGAVALPLVACQIAEPCGAGVDTVVIGAALITAGVYATKLTYNHFSSEQSLIRSIAREFGISAAALGNAVHAWKRAHGMGPADNMTAEQLRELASEVKQGLWLGTE